MGSRGRGGWLGTWLGWWMDGHESWTGRLEATDRTLHWVSWPWRPEKIWAGARGTGSREAGPIWGLRSTQACG